MSAPKWTSGPLHQHPTYRNRGHIAEIWLTTEPKRLERGQAVAKVMIPVREVDYTDQDVIDANNAEVQANADLFAAAPEMYDELKRKDSALRRIAAALSAAERGEDPIRDAMRDAHRMVYMAMREPREQEFWPWTEGDDRSMPKSPAILRARGYGR